MSRKKKKEPESVLQGAKIPPGTIQGYGKPEKKTSPVITVPLALVGIAVVIFGLVKWVKFAWYF